MSQFVKSVVVTRDDLAFAPMSTEQVHYTLAKQHPSGMIVAGGAMNQRAQAVQIWLSSEPEQAGALSLNPISFFSGSAANKRSKTIECPQEGIVSSLWNLLSGIQPNEMITSIAFEPALPSSQ